MKYDNLTQEILDDMHMETKNNQEKSEADRKEREFEDALARSMGLEKYPR